MALAHVPKVELPDRSLEESAAGAARKGARRAWFADVGWVECPLYERERLRPGARLTGPGIVEQVDSTTVVHPGQTLAVDAQENLILT